MTQQNAILGLLAQTSIHAGTGQNVGVIDLTIQREGHTGWPCVFGSAMKGALRAHAEAHYQGQADGENRITQTFGPDTNNASEHAGALSVMDARLLLLPVRSLTSRFCWVTSIGALKRYVRDAQRFNIPAEAITLPEPKTENAYVYAEDRELFLEEYRYHCKAKGDELDAVIRLLTSLMQHEDAEEALQKQLVIVNDDDFTFLVQHATPVNAHIALDSSTKTVLGGALWYEETLPPETLLYVGLNANKGRTRGKQEKEQDSQAEPLPAESVLQTVTDMFGGDHYWLQIGGNETVGMGWCAVKAVRNTATGEANHA